MQKDRLTRTLSIITLCLVVVSITIGYAALSSTLTIGGTATVAAPTWGIRFQSGSIVAPTVENNGLVGNATAPVTAPVFSEENTIFSGDFGTVSTPGDVITWLVDVENYGNIDAEFSALTKGAISCAPAEGSAATTAQAEEACSKITWDIETTTSEGPTCGDSLLKSNGGIPTEEQYKLILSYDVNHELSSLPAGPITVTLGNSTLVYVQDGQANCTLAP